MQRICRFLIVILFFSIATGYACAQRAPDVEVEILDPNLESAIRNALDKEYDEPIYVKDLKRLRELDAPDERIADLTGLEYCTNLEYLDLRLNKITDIAPLSELVNLKVLNLENNWITDIKPLSELVNLRELYLGCNEITDISPLVRNSGLSEGDRVDLKGNPLSSRSKDVYIPRLKRKGVKVSTVSLIGCFERDINK